MNDLPGAGVLHPHTISQLQSQVGKEGRLAVGSWCQSNREQAKAWEADGSLLRRAKEADSLAQDKLEQARRDGFSHLAPHEIYELYGGPTLDLR